MSTSLTFYPIGGSLFAVAIIAAVLVAVFLFFPPRGTQLTPKSASFIRWLRMAALVLLTLFLLRPTLVSTNNARLSSTVFLLVDTSESMTISDAVGGTSRFALARQTLDATASALATLAGKTELLPYAFDIATTSLTLRDGRLDGLPETPHGTSTAIGAALDDLLVASSGKRVLGTILISDGNQRTRPPRDISVADAASRYRHNEIPLYTVCFGQPTGSSSTQDVALTDVQANDTIFLSNEMTVTGTVRISGFVQKPIEVTLLVEAPNGILEPVVTTTITAREDGESVRFQLRATPQHLGIWKYIVTAAEQPKELLTTNNAVPGFFRVIEGGVSVLMVSGRRRFEQRWIRRALDASADIKVSTWYLAVDDAFARDTAGDPLQRLASVTAARPSEIGRLLSPDQQQVIILDNVDAAALQLDEQEWLAGAVRSGAGMLWLGGTHAFGAGGYAETPLANAAPVVMTSLDRQRDDDHFRGDVHWTGDIAMRPTSIGQSHPVMRLGNTPDKNRTLWEGLPPLDGANKLGTQRMGAFLLAEGAGGEPLLVSQLFGRGRVLAFAGDSTWRWVLGGEGDTQRRFWRQVILWLAQMDEIAAGECRVVPDSFRLMPGEPLTFQILAKDGFGVTFVPQTPATTATCRRPDGSVVALEPSSTGETCHGTVRDTLLPGDYTIEATIPFPDGQSHTASGRFLVTPQNVELENPVANPRLLERIATDSAGRSVLPEEFPQLLADLSQQADLLVEARQQKWSLYDSFFTLILFVSLLAAEWVARRIGGVI